MGLILVATDFSKNCSKVLEKAIFLANQRDYQLKVIHVIEDGIFDFNDNDSKIKFNCLSFLNENFPNIEEKDFYIRVGSIEDEVSKLTKELAASMLVIGASGENFSFEKLIMGSTTKKIIRELEVPTLVIKNETLKDYKNILMPTDFTDESKTALTETLKLLPNSFVKLLHVYSVPFSDRLNMYGIDKGNAQDYITTIVKDVSREGSDFINSLDEKNRVVLETKNDILIPDYFNDTSRNSLGEIDLISLHTTGSISFFTFDMLEKSKKDVLIFKR